MNEKKGSNDLRTTLRTYLDQDNNKISNYQDAMTILMQDEREIYKISEELIYNDKFILEAIRRNPYVYSKIAFWYPDLATKKDVVKTALLSIRWWNYGTPDFKIEYDGFRIGSFDTNIVGGSLFDRIRLDNSLSDDEEIIKLCYGVFRIPLRAASERIQNEREMVLEAVQDDGDALEFASDQLKNDEEVALTAIKHRGIYETFDYVGEMLKQNKEFCLKALKAGARFYEMDEQFRNDRSFILEAIKEGARFDRYAINDDVLDNKQFLITLLKLGVDYKDICNIRPDDKEVALMAIMINHDNVKYLSDELKNDPDIVSIIGNNEVEELYSVDENELGHNRQMH